jgi:RimJ/RimL family protein N-acetyltransferase
MSQPVQVTKVLAEAQDKTGKNVSIKHVSQIGYSPVFTFYLKNYAELIEANIGYPVFRAKNNAPAIYAEIDGKVVGHIVYEFHDDPIRTAWIILSAVDSNFRQRGIYNLMHAQFEKFVKAAGSKRISSHVHVNNLARQASCESCGMKKVWYKMEKDI